ncbi:MAG: right-handed parallel beta-helix repeat-containing protein [Bacteroidales bacterium]|nr:right-handed parallel beta-helix repeat-containing protein [Bacteroidales bacterium]
MTGISQNEHIIYVDINSPEGGDGSREHPFRLIGDAAKVAAPGDTVLVAPGVYREWVDPVNAGAENARITYRSTEPLGAEITGAEPLSYWEPFEGNVWVCRVDNSVFGDYNPYTTLIGGDWYFMPPSKHTGAVYLNDRALYEAVSLEECIKGEAYWGSWESEYSVYKWYSEQDTDADMTVIYANFQGKDPNREKVEISVRRRCFFPSKTGVGYITLSGFKVDKAATTWAPPAAFQDGMIGPHWSKGWIIEDCEVYLSKCCGISLGKYMDPDNDNFFTNKYVKSATQMERDAVCRGQYHGWLKENVGSHIVRRCHIHHCEQAGIVGRMGCVFSVIEDNHIHNINNMQELGGAEIAGIKLHAAIDVLFRRNHIHHCTMGIWCDWEAQGTRITRNLMHDNHLPESNPLAFSLMSNQDIFIEVGHGPTLIDNNVLLSKCSLRMPTQGIAFVHNLCMGTLADIGSGTAFMVNGNKEERYTPYHFPHRTEVMGFMSILHGDDRFYNNIFVQGYPVKKTAPAGDMGMVMQEVNTESGTFVFDEYPTYGEWIKQFHMESPADMFLCMPAHFSHLPVWAGGNAYLAGAKAWKKEESFLCDKSPVKVELTEKDGEYFLKTDIFEVIGRFRGESVSTETLGKAFEPDQPFENPDGTPIVFDTDYFGLRREAAIPGPFANTWSEFKLL